MNNCSCGCVPTVSYSIEGYSIHCDNCGKETGKYPRLNIAVKEWDGVPEKPAKKQKRKAAKK